MTAEYLVQRADPQRFARAVVAYQVKRPQFWGPMLAITAGVGVLGSSAGGSVAVVGVVLCLLIIGGVTAYKRRQLAAVLAARGFRPGTTITAEFGDTQLTIAAHGGTAVHPYTEIADVHRHGGVVLLRLRQARLVVALPVELVPEAHLQGLRGAP